MAAIKLGHIQLDDEPNWLMGDLGKYPDSDVSTPPTAIELVQGEKVAMVDGPIQQSDLMKPLLMDIAKKGLAYAYNKYQKGVLPLMNVQPLQQQTANPKHVLIVGAGMAGLVVASFPGSCVGGEKRAWYTLFAHAQFSQDFWEFGNYSKICSVTLTSARHADFSRTKDACH